MPTDSELVKSCRKYVEGRHFSSEIAEDLKGYMAVNSKLLTAFPNFYAVYYAKQRSLMKLNFAIAVM